jgi:hypothetical protein
MLGVITVPLWQLLMIRECRAAADQGGCAIMGQSQPFAEILPPLVEGRPICPRCEMRMITVTAPQQDLHYQCLRCDYIEECHPVAH